MAIEASLRQASTEATTSPVNSSLRLATARTVQMDDLAFEAYAVKVLDSDNDVIYRYWYDEDIQAIAEAIAFRARAAAYDCLLYTSDAADDLLCVDLGGRRIIKKKKNYDTP